MRSRILLLLAPLLSFGTVFADSTPTNFVRAKIAFTTELEGGLHLFDLTNHQVRQVWVGMPNISALHYNHRHNILVFEGSRYPQSPKSIYLYYFKNKTIKKIHHADSLAASRLKPRFHPSGDYIYAVNYRRGISRYSLKTDSWERVPVDNTAEIRFKAVSFSRSGKVVAISPDRYNGFIIADVINGRFVVRKHILNKFVSATSPRWIGDKAIVFVGRAKPGAQRLWRVSVGRVPRLKMLTRNPIAVREFVAVSRDQKTLVFTGMKDNVEWRLWKMSINGDKLEQLTKGGRLSSHLSPAWID